MHDCFQLVRYMRAFLSILVLAIWGLGGLYCGISGWLGCNAVEKTVTAQPSSGSAVIYHDIPFASEGELREFLSQESDAQFSPWLYATPQSLWPLIASLGFGLLGGTGRILKYRALDKTAFAVLPVFSAPLFGALLGTLLFYLSYLVPTFLVVSENRVRPTSLAAIALFGGFFSEHTFAWIERQYKDILSKFGKK